MRFEANNTAMLDKSERKEMNNVASTLGAIGRLAKKGSDLEQVCNHGQASILAVMMRGEVIDLEDEGFEKASGRV